MLQATITFEYRKLDLQNNLKTLIKFTFMSVEECRVYLQGVYNSMTLFEQAAAKFDFDLTVGMVTDVNLNDITSLNLKAGEEFMMPFGFVSKNYYHWLDIVITAKEGFSIG